MQVDRREYTKYTWRQDGTGGTEDITAKLLHLAESMLLSHKGNGHCKDCPHVEYGEDFQRCKGGDFDCCKCAACKVAREFLSD